MKKIILAFLLVLALPAWAVQSYTCACETGADNKCIAGNDSNDGLTDLTPKLTLAAGFAATGGSAREASLCTGGAWNDVATTLSAAITISAYSPNTCKEGCRLKRPILREARGGQVAITVSGGTGHVLRDVAIYGGGTGATGVTSSVTGSPTVPGVTLERVTLAGFATVGFTCTAGNFVLKDSAIKDNASGVISNCSDSTIERNKFDNNASASCVDSIGTCTTKHAVVLNGPLVTGRGVVLRANEIKRTGNLSGARCATKVVVATGRHKGLLIEGNEIIETDPSTACWAVSLEGVLDSGDGVEGFPNAVIRGNRLVNVGGVGIGVASCQNCNIENNLILRTSELGSTAVAEDFSAVRVAGHGTSDLTSQAVWVRSNSIYLHAGTAASKGIAFNAGVQLGMSSNFIHLGGSTANTQCIDTTGITTAELVSIDYNLCYRNGGAPRYSEVHATMSAAQAFGFFPLDVHGSTADPVLIAPPTRDSNWSMAVNVGGPTINTGEPGRATRVAYAGHPAVGLRDIGAEEFEAQGKTYIVAKTGSDSNNGLTTATPFLTIQHALNLVEPGDTVAVRTGTYNQSLMASRPGLSTARITLRGYGKEMPIIRGTTIGPSLYFYTEACEAMVEAGLSGNVDCTPMYWTVSGLEIRGSATGGGDGNAVKIDTPKVRLQGNKLCCSAADIVKLVRTANDAEVLDNELWQDSGITVVSDNAQGVDSVGTDRIRIAGNYVHDITSIGMYCKGNCRNAVFENNLIVNVADHAMMMGQETDIELLLDGDFEAYDGIMRNNVVMNTDRACFAISSAYNVKALNNSCYNTGLVQHGSVFLSNESLSTRASEDIEIANNIIFAGGALPVIKITADAFLDVSTLRIHDNIYWRADGAPLFTPNAEFAAVNAATWFADYAEMSGNTDDSRVLNPQYKSVAGKQPLMLADNSPAINMGHTHASVVHDFNWRARPIGPKHEIGAYEYTRTALADTTGPTIISRSPVASGTFVPIAATVSVTFSEAVDCTTVTSGSFTVSGGVTGAVTCDGVVALFTPSANLAYSTTYTVTLTPAVKDIAGNVLTGTRTSTFSTVAPPAEGYVFNFLVYGDSRSNNVCGGNAIHLGLVAQMAAEPASFVLHVGDMIAGLYDTTNWVNRGVCPLGTSTGSFQEQIAPLQSKTPAAGLSTFYFPVIGNHDDGWNDSWYPDTYGQGVCSVFDIQSLVQNHTAKTEYFQDFTRPNIIHYSDAEFYSLMCSTNTADAYKVYPTYAYYTFKHMNSQFVVLRINQDYYDLMACGNCSGQYNNYDHYYYIHQLHWLRYVLNAAQADSTVQNVFIFAHTPFLTRSEHPANASMTTLLTEFSQRNKVKMVFSGHNHVYERSYPVTGNSTYPMGVRDDTNGVIYFTTGGGGSPGNAFIRTEPLMNVGLYDSHYMKVEVNGSSVTAKAINTTGAIIDQVTK